MARQHRPPRTRATRTPAKPPRSSRARVRRRRSPEVARVEIMDAAERVFVEFQPDAVGLKEIAHEAGVSHALITHYFGTYAGLIEAVLERRIRAVREVLLARLRETGALSRPGELLDVLFQGLTDPVHLRLAKWMMASERPGSAHAFALRDHGLQLVAHQIAAALEPRVIGAQMATLEMTLLAAVAATYGYAMGKYALAGAAGRQPTDELDREVLKTIGAMVESYLRSELGVAPPRK